MPGTLLVAGGAGRGELEGGRSLDWLLMLLALSACSPLVTGGLSWHSLEEERKGPLATVALTSLTDSNQTPHLHTNPGAHLSTVTDAAYPGGPVPHNRPEEEHEEELTNFTNSYKKTRSMLLLFPGVGQVMLSEGGLNTNRTEILDKKRVQEGRKVGQGPSRTQSAHGKWDTARIRAISSRQKTKSHVIRLHMYIQSIMKILLWRIHYKKGSPYMERISSQSLTLNREDKNHASHERPQGTSVTSNTNKKHSINLDVKSSRRSNYDVIARARRSASPKRHEKSRSKSRSKRFHLKKRYRELEERKVVQLVRGPWLLAVTENGTVYTTNDVHNPHSRPDLVTNEDIISWIWLIREAILISYPVDAQLVALKTNNTREFLTFDKKGRLSTRRGLNRRTHFIVTPTLDNHYTYLSKYRSKHYWYLGITDTGFLTAYTKTRQRKQRRNPGHGKKKGRDKKPKSKTKATSAPHTRFARDAREDDSLQVAESLLNQKVVIDSETPVSRAVTQATTQDIPSDYLVVGEQFESNPRSIKTSTADGHVKTPKSEKQPNERRSKKRHKHGQRKNSNRRRRKGRRCKSQRCTCIRNNAIAPWCQFQIVTVGETDTNDWPWIFHKSALDLSRSPTR